MKCLGIALLSAVAAIGLCQSVDFNLERMANYRRGWYDLRTESLSIRSQTPLAQFSQQQIKRHVSARHQSFWKDTEKLISNKQRPKAPHFLDQDLNVALCTQNIVSVWYEVYEFRYGSLERRTVETMNFAMVGGSPRKLTLEMALGRDSVPAELSNRILMDINRERELNGSSNLNSLKNDVLNNFVLTSSEIVWVVDKRVTGSYRDQVFKFRMPLSQVLPYAEAESPLRR